MFDMYNTKCSQGGFVQCLESKMYFIFLLQLYLEKNVRLPNSLAVQTIAMTNSKFFIKENIFWKCISESSRIGGYKFSRRSIAMDILYKQATASFSHIANMILA